MFFWVSGFDIIYALQDKEFDKELKLKSIPTLLGKKHALNFSKLIHFFAAVFIALVAILTPANWIHLIGSSVFIALLLYQHTLVKHNDLSKVDTAFFTTNGIASVIYGLLVVVSLFV